MSTASAEQAIIKAIVEVSNKIGPGDFTEDDVATERAPLFEGTRIVSDGWEANLGGTMFGEGASRLEALADLLVRVTFEVADAIRAEKVAS